MKPKIDWTGSTVRVFSQAFASATALASMLIASPPVAGAHGGTAGAGGQCVPLVEYHGGIRTCFPSVMVGRAEHMFGKGAVRPSFAVRRVKGPTLRQTIVLSGTGPGGPGPPHAIVYVFGIPDPACRTTPDCTPGSPYVIVQETRGLIFSDQLQVLDEKGWTPGPWHGEVNMRCSTLSLEVISNTSRRAVRAIGRSVVRKAACRRPPLRMLQ